MTPGHGQPLVDAAEIEEIDLQVLARVHDLIHGEHASIYSSTSGVDFTGLREWEPGDARSQIDWAHSTINAFSPLVVRESVESHALDVIIGADVSLSTRCGVPGMTIGRVVARAIATIGLSASIFQDSVGLVLYDFASGRGPWVEPPHRGRSHVLRLIDLYQAGYSVSTGESEGLTAIISRELRRTSMVFVISDFLFPHAADAIRDLAALKPRHDPAVGCWCWRLPGRTCSRSLCQDKTGGRGPP